MNRCNAPLLNPALEMKLAPLVREGKPSRSTVLAIGGHSESGPSGTGKTLAATVIARFGKPVLEVSSKFIGETEKNLARLIEQADRTGAILLFDEADALFGKRTDVKESHDRYASLDVSYLLDLLANKGIIAILIGLRGQQPRTGSTTHCRWVDLP